MQTAFYQYTLERDTAQPHTLIITLIVPAQEGKHTDFAIPAWRPGRYILQNYSAAVSGFRAKSATNGQPLSVEKTDKDTWRVTHGNDSKEIEIRYQVFAKTQDAGSSYVDERLLYVNGANVLMYVPNRLEEVCELQLLGIPNDWKVATDVGLKKLQDQSWLLSCNSYHRLIDAPILASATLHEFEDKLKGRTFHYVFQGKYGASRADEEAFMKEVDKVIRAETAVFDGELPVEHYWFLFLLVDFQMRHAVEHANSAMFVMPEATTTEGSKLAGLMSIVAHEFFHVWNVKRLRPAALRPYEYSREHYTTLHWFTEGVTDYYTSLSLVRTGFYPRQKYLDLIASQLRNIDNNPANKLISPAQSSMDSWLATSPYQPDHLRTSYYPLGSRVGLLLDLTLRRDTKDEVTLDVVMNHLYRKHYLTDTGIPENGILLACNELTNKDYTAFFQKYVNGTETADYASLFASFGLKFTSEVDTDDLLKRLGFARSGETAEGFVLEQIRWGSDASLAGLRAGDVLLEVDAKKIITATNALSAFETLAKGKVYQLRIARDGEIRNLELTFTAEHELVKYSLVPTGEANALLENWLKGK
jgi:predicted metalloprotease with PDZ domain